MIQIGKIVHNEKLVNHKPLPYILYRASNEGYLEDIKNVPTLIIGWKLINTLVPRYNYDILQKELHFNNNNKYFWEFSPSENIIQSNTGVELFVKRLPYLFISKFLYKNIDPFFNNLYTSENIESFFPAGGDLYVYKNEMAYYRVGDTIYGLKLTIYDYLGVDTQVIVSALVTKSKNHNLDDSTEFQKYYRIFPEFGFLKRSMVVFLFP